MLPPELLMEIFSYLAQEDLLSSSSVNKEFRVLLSTSYFWKRRFIQDNLLQLEELSGFTLCFNSYLRSISALRVVERIKRKERLVRLSFTRQVRDLLLASSLSREKVLYYYDLTNKEGSNFLELLEKERTLCSLEEKSVVEENELFALQSYYINPYLQGEVILRMDKTPLCSFSLCAKQKAKLIFLRKENFTVPEEEFFLLIYKLKYYRLC